MRQTVTVIDDWLDQRPSDAPAGDPPARESAIPAARQGGRMWLNGAEAGGADPRFAHLGAGHD